VTAKFLVVPSKATRNVVVAERDITGIYGESKGTTLQAYLDDLAVGSDTPAQHVADVRDVLNRTRKANLRLKLSKCAFGRNEVEVLGHKVSHGRVQPNDRHRDCLRDFAEPTNVTELLRFLGLLQFFASHIDRLAEMARPLYHVLGGTGWNEKKPRKRVIELPDWNDRWGDAQREAFRRLRGVLADPSFLVPARAGARKRLCTDASKYGLGVALLQDEGGEGWLPIGFASRKLKGAEPRYTTTEKENLAVVFGLRKFRHHLYGEQFEVVTDHVALTWLLSLRDPKERLARWIVEMQTFNFEVLYERGDGALMAVPDALSRDTMDKDVVLCHRCLEAVNEVTEEAGGATEVLTADEMRAAQREAYGEDGVGLGEADCAEDEDGVWCKVFGKEDVRVVVPPALRQRIVSIVHGSRASGHWGVLRTAAKIRSRYYWPGWTADVRKAVMGCLACGVERLPRPGRQARMVRYHPRRRFELVAVDVLEMTPVTSRGNRKILVVGDMFTRFVVAVAMADEGADTVARELFERWISVFGPPEQLLSDRGPNFTGEVIGHLCRMVGTRKVFTSAYHPQGNGFVERYNRTLCAELKRHLLEETDWDLTLPMATFRYNATQHAATGVTPYRAVYGVDVFEFDCALLQRYREDDEPEELSQRLKEVHGKLFARGSESRDVAARAYDRAVSEVRFEEGARVMVYDDAGAVAQGRKLRTPWLGPYRVEKRLSEVSYMLRAESDARVARAHANRLRLWTSEGEEDARNPEAGLWPDSRRTLRAILGQRERDGKAEYRVRRAGRRGFAWVPERDLPEIVVRAYQLIKARE